MTKHQRDQMILGFIEVLDRCDSTEQAFDTLSARVTELGFTAISYSAIPQTLGSVAAVFFSSSNFSQGFLDHYVEAGLHAHDFTISRIRQGHTLPMDWAAERLGGQLTTTQSSVIDLARYDYGIRNGLSIPTLSDKHIIAGATLTSSEAPQVFTPMKSLHLKTLKSLLFLFHSYVFSQPACRTRFYQPFIDSLKRDDLCIIELIVEGLPLKQAATRYGISASRAANILSSLYQRLNIRKGHELCYLFGRHMIMEMIQLSMTETKRHSMSYSQEMQERETAPANAVQQDLHQWPVPPSCPTRL